MSVDPERPAVDESIRGAEPRRPDWYPDPLRRHSLRFWDGRRWTERVSDAGRTTEDNVDLDLADWLEPRQGDRRSRWPGWVAWLSLGVGVVGIIAATSVASVVDGKSNVLGSVAAGASVLYTVLLAHCLLIQRVLGSSRGVRFDLGFQFRLVDVAWGFVISICARLAAVLSTLPLAFIDEDYLVPDRNLFRDVEFGVGLLLVTTVVALVLAPPIEELFFRGVLQRSFESTVPTWVAIAVSSVLFGFAHVSPHLGAANVGIVAGISAGGAVLGLAAHVTRRLGPSVIGHAFFNVIPMALAWAAL